MRWRTSTAPIALLAVAGAVALWPAIAQRSDERGPQSILPPGFGQPDAPPPPPRRDEPAPSNASEASPGDPGDVPTLALNPPSSPTGDSIGGIIDTLSDNGAVAVAETPDVPLNARRSLDRVGLVDGDERGFGAIDGGFLTTLMRRIEAPLASRWASIALRRALLLPSAVPTGTNGADWVAERAWLLLRMGEADMGRALVARVDTENFTPRLSAIAMQAALATGDPAVVCPIADSAASDSDEPSWPLAQAMCAGLSGESGTASALIDRVRDRGLASGIDVLLAEKVIGAGGNTRRAVNIQWDGVDRLTAWRFGLATATGLTVPSSLYTTAGPQVQAWLARAPLIAAAARTDAADRAAELGVFSSAALNDFYAALWDATDVAERSGLVGTTLRAAYAGDSDAARAGALRSLWGSADGVPYARLILTAPAAALIAPGSISGADADHVVAAMLSAGLDIQAARWANVVAAGSPGWAMLAVGAPRPLASATASAAGGFDNGGQRGRFLLAGLAGLGRLTATEASTLAQSEAVPLGRASSWTRALDRAVAARAPAAVMLIAAAGLQTRDWRFVPPEHLYHIVAALHRVGLDPEARMIAAEAIARG